MRGNAHAGFGGRAGETDRRKRRHRAPVRPTWANHGPTALWNLVLLCRFHHRVIHHAGYQMYAYGDQTFSFHRPDGTPIPTAAPSPGGQPDHPKRANQQLGLPITADSLPPDWDGTPPDYDTAAQVLLDATFPRNAHDEHNTPHAEPVPAEHPCGAEDLLWEPVSAENPWQHHPPGDERVSAEPHKQSRAACRERVSAERPQHEPGLRGDAQDRPG